MFESYIHLVGARFMEVLLTFAYGVVFYFIIRRSTFYKTEGVASYLPGVIFLLKCISGILLGLLYTYYYTNHKDADSFKFFTDSKFIFDTLLTRPKDFFRMLTGINGNSPDLLHYYMEMNSWLNLSPIYNDNRTIVRLNTFFRFFSFGHYYVHVVFLNFISFTGLFCLYKSFINYTPEKKRELLFLTFLMPSMMFWGSGLLKDGLLISGFGIFIYSCSQLMKPFDYAQDKPFSNAQDKPFSNAQDTSFSYSQSRRFTRRRIIFLLIGLTILVFTKAYVIIILFPGLIAWWITRNFKSAWKTVFTYVSIYGIIIIIAFNLYHFNDNYNVAAVLFYKQKNMVEIGDQHAARMIEPINYECSGPSILIHSPKAFLNTLFRPFFSDVNGNPLVLISAFENLILGFLFLIVILFFKPPNREAISFLMFNICMVVLLFVLIGLITPILGAIVRYRIIALPALTFIILNFYDREKMMKKIRRLVN